MDAPQTMLDQPSLIDDLTRETPAPRKRVRDTSIAAFAELMQPGAIAAREQEFLRTLETYLDAGHEPPTIAELVEWAWQQRIIPRPDPNRYRPRATALAARGVIVVFPARVCRTSGKMAHPVRIAERR